MRQYNEFLQVLIEFSLLDNFLKCRFFSCQKCRTFSVKVPAFYKLLKELEEHNDFAAALVYDLKENVDIESWQLELSDQPAEIIEKFLDKDTDYPEMLNEAIKDLVVEDEMVFRFPYEDCSFVFDTTCDCNRILRA